MKHLAAYMLAKIGGTEEPTAADIEKILKGASADYNADTANSIVESIKGKNYEDLIAAGKKRMVSVGGASGAPAAAGAAAAAPVQKEKTPEEEIVAGFGFASSSSEEESSS